MLRGFCLR
uniref:Uncharacterized protein n=1 Tax=Anguilla anguilla TaxID=7936 RepID=A0A0E9X943_ANGAN